MTWLSGSPSALNDTWPTWTGSTANLAPNFGPVVPPGLVVVDRDRECVEPGMAAECVVVLQSAHGLNPASAAHVATRSCWGGVNVTRLW